LTSEPARFKKRGAALEDRTRSQTAGQNIVVRFIFDHIVLTLTALVVAATVATYWYLSNLQEQLVSTLAAQGARLQSETLAAVRGLYTSEVVDKVRRHGIEVTHDYQGKDNAIPLPATLTIELGRLIGETGSGAIVRLYSEYPFPWRKDGGPRDAFEQDALSALRSNPGQPFSRVESYQSQQVIRYAVADRMLVQCIACHNSHPASPKTDWKVGDVRGVLEITRPLTPLTLAARQSLQQALGLMAVIALLGMTGVGLVLGKQRRHAMGLAAEIKERKRVEADLRASTARFSAMEKASPLGNFVTDAQGNCLHVNQMFHEITGYSDEAMRGKPWNTGVHPEDRERVLAQWQNALEQNHTFAVECRFTNFVDGASAWVSCKAAPMRSGDQLLGYIGTLEDISDRKEVERVKNEFISTVSHELRTPLTSIMGSLGLLAEGVGGELSGQTRTLVELASKNSERLVRLINDILDIEKIESGHMPFDLQPLELQPLTEQAMAANRPYAEQFSVSFALTTEVPDSWVRADADRLMQVMTNLMSNAAKFSPRGASVDLRITRQANMIRFAVADRGPGIPESFRRKVFEKFSQADASDSRKKGGTGLGLSICKAIVEATGGSIGFVSREGEGTTFYFDLPEAAGPEPASAKAVSEAVPRRAKVLVCEDDKDVATLLCMMLGQAGYDAVPAHDAASARRLLAADSFAAMTLDIRLPDLDGKALLQELRADPATRDLCVVVVSGHLRSLARPTDGDGLGVREWLTKPIDQARLLDAVRNGIQGGARGKSRILHVEDDPDLRQVVGSLCAEVAEFDGAASFHEASALLSTEHYDLVILDLSLPDGSGWDLLPIIDQQTPRPPVLVFSVTELSAAESGRVAAALVKSHVSNPELLNIIHTLTSKTQSGGQQT
jgi:PAS domain S-box-containing protein